jgi:hypothetical protein
VEVDRGRVLAYRMVAHELDRADRKPSDLAVLDLGVQDTPSGTARLALSARTSAPLDAPDLVPVWAARGAPHLHRAADLVRLALALWPGSDADATARINVGPIKEGARLGIAAFTAAAAAFRATVTAPMPRGEVSTAVSALVPASLTYDCKPCGARHISGALFQQAGLFGGVRLLPGPRGGTLLGPIEGWPGVPSAAVGTSGLVAAYLRLLGPATPADVAKFLGTTVGTVRTVWPSDLAEVQVDGSGAWLPADRVDLLRSAPRPSYVRLIPPSDPFLQARDRAVLVPDKARQAVLWTALGNPGAMLVDGEIAGTWRAKLARKSTLDVTVTAFGSLPARVRPAVEEEAARIAEVRGAPSVQVTVAG